MTIIFRTTQNVSSMLLGVLLLSCITAEAADKSMPVEQGDNTEEHATAEKSSLRCWQQGKLLFTELDWHSFTVTNKDNVLNFTHADESDSTLSLINMGESICIYKK